MSEFMEPEDIVKLTGRTQRAMQIRALKKMGVAFFVNDIGRPVVLWDVVKGKQNANVAPAKKPWVPKVLQAG